MHFPCVDSQHTVCHCCRDPYRAYRAYQAFYLQRYNSSAPLSMPSASRSLVPQVPRAWPPTFQTKVTPLAGPQASYQLNPALRGHAFKLYERNYTHRSRAVFLSECVINVQNQFSFSFLGENGGSFSFSFIFRLKKKIYFSAIFILQPKK